MHIQKESGMLSNNFIGVIEQKYVDIRKKLKGDRSFVLYLPAYLMFSNGKKLFFEMKHFLDRRGNHRTQVLYRSGGLRIYFSDANILSMLLTIDSETKRNSILNALSAWLNNDTYSFEMNIKDKNYTFQGIYWPFDNTIFHTKQDVDIPEQDLIAIINMVIAKDIATTEMGSGTYDFAARTIKKYLSLLRWYWFKDFKIKKQLEIIGYDVEKDINYNFNNNLYTVWKPMDLRFQELEIE